MPVSIGGSGFITGLDQGIAGVGIITAATFSGDLTGNVNATGISTIATLNSTNTNITGVTTTATLNATSIVGVTTAGITTAYINTLSGISTISADSSVYINQNLIFPSGKGIDFSATTDGSGTTTSELLDDYEEGTFTPTFTNAGTATYAIQVGHYIKIGNKVTSTIMLQFASAGTASGSVGIAGLPFIAKNVSNLYGVSSSIHGTGWSVTRNNVNILIPPGLNSTFGMYYNMVAQGATYGVVQHSDLGTGNLIVSFTYIAN